MADYVSPVNQFLKSIDIQPYDRYLPNAFNDSLSLLEKVNKIIYHMQESNQITNEMALKWNKFTEWVNDNGIDAPIEEKINSLLNDGTFKNLIDTQVMTEFKEEIYNQTDETINNVNNQLNDFTSQITDMKTKTYGRATKTLKNMITIYVDDAAPEDLSLILPITKSKGIPVTIAAITRYVKQKQTYSMTITQLKHLQDVEGWEIHSHTDGHVNLPTKTEQEIDYELKESQSYLESNGIHCEGICFPYGYYNDTVLKITRKYYRVGIGSDQGVNNSPINTYNTFRLNFDAYDLATLKEKVDSMNNQWAIIYTHSQQWVTDGKVEENKVKLNELITYIQSKNIPLVNSKIALDTFENLLDIGDSTQKFMKVGADGTVKQNPVIPLATMPVGSGITEMTPITFFEKHKMTITSFTSLENFGLKTFATGVSGGGTLLTFRNHNEDGLSFQIFYTSENTHVLRRMWNNGSSSWNAWKVIGPMTTRREIYIDPVLPNASRVYDFSIPILRVNEPVLVTFEGELETGLLYSANVVEAGKLKFKIYNVTGTQIPVGVRYLRVVQY